jgi:hypothetical protein
MQVDQSGGICSRNRAPRPCFALDSAAPVTSAHAYEEEAAQLQGMDEVPLLTPEDITAIGVAGTDPQIEMLSEDGGGIIANPDPWLPAEDEFHIAASLLAAVAGVGRVQGAAPLISLGESSGSSGAVVASLPKPPEGTRGVDLL